AQDARSGGNCLAGTKRLATRRTIADFLSPSIQTEGQSLWPFELAGLFGCRPYGRHPGARSMIRVRHALPLLLGAGLLGAMMATAPDFDTVFRPLRVAAPSGAVAQGRLHAARFADWQTAEQLSFNRYGSAVIRDSSGIFLVVDVDILD